MHLDAFIDGASRGNPGPASVGVVLKGSSGATVQEFHRYIGHQTNNVAEYSALLDALKLAVKLGATTLKVHSDSQLLVRQMAGQYRVKNRRLFGFLKDCQALRQGFKCFEIVHIPRELNTRADKLANMALDAVKKSPDSASGKVWSLELEPL